MKKTTAQLRADMGKGGLLMKLTTLILIIRRYEKGNKNERSEAREALMEAMRGDSLSMTRYAAYLALSRESNKNEAVRRSTEEFEIDPRNARIISLMSEES